MFGPALKRSKKGRYCQGDLSIWLLEANGGHDIKIFGPALERPEKWWSCLGSLGVWLLKQDLHFSLLSKAGPSFVRKQYRPHTHSFCLGIKIFGPALERPEKWWFCLGSQGIWLLRQDLHFSGLSKAGPSFVRKLFLAYLCSYQL